MMSPKPTRVNPLVRRWEAAAPGFDRTVVSG